MARRFSLLVVFILVVTACATSGTDTTSGPVTTPVTTEATDPTVTTGLSSSTTRPTTPPVTEPDLSGVEGLPEGMQAQLEALIVTAQEIRELAFLSPPVITVVTDAELEQRVRSSIEEETEDFPADESLYKLLGLLAPEADLEQILLDLYGEQVAGFYDGETGEIVVPAHEEGFSILQQATMIHELVHAITDQNFGFDAEFDLMIDEERLDEAAGFQALIEGDAQLAEVHWLQGLSQQELGRFIAESLQIDTTSFDAAPQFIADSLIFPYDSGLAFTQHLHDLGGWQAVNEAYTTFPDLPGSTEQVITPDDYGRDLPTKVEMPTIDLVGYDLERTSVWGEEGFRVMLDQVFSGSVAAKAADGWGGDSYHQWFDGENTAFLLIYQGDTERDVEEMRATLLDYARGYVAEEDFVWVDEEAGLLYFIAADEVPVGELIRDTLGLS